MCADGKIVYDNMNIDLIAQALADQREADRTHALKALRGMYDLMEGWEIADAWERIWIDEARNQSKGES